MNSEFFDMVFQQQLQVAVVESSRWIDIPILKALFNNPEALSFLM